MGQLVFQATLGGQVNLVGPNTASTFNLNVPAVSSTLATLAAQTFTGTQTMTTLTSPAATNFTLQSAGTTAVTIDTSQNVGIGTSSPSSKLYVSGTGFISDTFQVSGTATTVNANGIGLEFRGSSTPSIIAYSRVGSAYLPMTTSASLHTWDTSGTERMRIDTSGNLLVGTTSTVASGGFRVVKDYDAANCANIDIGHITGSASGNRYATFAYAGSNIGSITQNGTTGVLYNLTSDYRLKNNPVALTGAKDFVMALQPKTWDWWDGSGKGVGFIAHEFMEVAKYSGHGEKDAVDSDGNPIHQSIQPSSSEVMANMVALMQEQQATINALTARVVALEAK
jgi:hypothetical protein